jgi:hypothetical protein
MQLAAGDEAADVLYDLQRELAVAAWIFAGVYLFAPWHSFVPSFDVATKQISIL